MGGDLLGSPEHAWIFEGAGGLAFAAFLASHGRLAARFGWWRYVKTAGPTLHQARGDFPVLYPVAFFVLFAVVALWLVDDRDDTGRPRFERLARASGRPVGAGREARRAGAWILVM